MINRVCPLCMPENSKKSIKQNQHHNICDADFLVRVTGLEPARGCHQNLNVLTPRRCLKNIVADAYKPSAYQLFETFLDE